MYSLHFTVLIYHCTMYTVNCTAGRISLYNAHWSKGGHQDFSSKHKKIIFLSNVIIFSWKVHHMKGYCCILVLFYTLIFFILRRRRKMLSPLMQSCPQTLDITFLKIWKLVYLHNSNRIATNETEPFYCITSTSEEKKYTGKQRTSSHLVQIQALNLTK